MTTNLHPGTPGPPDNEVREPDTEIGEPVRVVGISGSLRRGSYNTALLRAAREVRPPGMDFELVPLNDVPLYSGDVERAGLPPAVAALRDAIAGADGLVIATPEYNYSISGVLKNAIDWASRPPDSPLDGKPLAIMGVGGRYGTLRAQLHLRQIALHNSMRVMIDPEIHLSRARDKFDADGALLDPDVRRALAEFLIAFAAWIAHSRRDPTLAFA